MHLLPVPQKIEIKTGHFLINYNTEVILKDTKPGALLYAKMLTETIASETGLLLKISRGMEKKGDIVLKDIGREEISYTISIDENNAILSGGSDTALCHAVQTFRQIVKNEGTFISCMEIEDYPMLENRGYYLDVSRGRIPTLQVLKKYADFLCEYKINEWQLYIEHTYLFKDLSEAWRDDEPLNAEEIMELDAYCADRNIELVPSLSTFGHMYKILSTKSFCDMCELDDSEKIPFTFSYAGNHHTLNVSNDRTIDFVKSLITEYMALFTSKKFNICADETFDLGKQRSAALAEEKGTEALYLSHVKELCEFLTAQGITPMFWGDIMWKFPEAYKALPQSTICLNWGYLPKQREDEIKAVADANAIQYVCPGVCAWNRWIPLFRDAFDNISIMSKHCIKYKAIGLLNTDWGDYGHINDPRLSKAGIIYGAVFAWNSGGIDFEKINQAVSLLEYSDRGGDFVKMMVALSDKEVLEWGRAVRFIEARDADLRKTIFDEIQADRADEANQALELAISELAKGIHKMSDAAKNTYRILAVITDGIRLWNEVAKYIAVNEYGGEYDALDGDFLAQGLEKWFLHYKLLWREVSNENGVARLTNLITAYADYLRGRKYGETV